jgi:hypothetical protein
LCAADGLIHFISTAVILLSSPALTV